MFSKKTVIRPNRPGGERRGKLRARIVTWAFAFVAGTALALVAYFVSWALTIVIMTTLLMFAIVQVSRTHKKERGQIESHMSRTSRNRDTIINVLLNVISLRDHGRMSQSDRIAELAAIVAWQLGLKEDDVRLVKQASMLHDVGKMGIADGVLAKPGELNEEEWAAMRRHPEVGHDILGEIASLQPVAEIIHGHHERVDGQGYPRGFKGDEIPIGARIYAVVDSYVAMTSDRPYRKKMPHDIAVKEIVRNSLSQFDPEVVQAFMRAEIQGLLREKGERGDSPSRNPVPSEV